MKAFCIRYEKKLKPFIIRLFSKEGFKWVLKEIEEIDAIPQGDVPAELSYTRGNYRITTIYLPGGSIMSFEETLPDMDVEIIHQE